VGRWRDLAAATDQEAPGAELIGTKAVGWEAAKWPTIEPLRLEDVQGKVVTADRIREAARMRGFLFPLAADRN
jgi:hypothetical protein